MKKIKLAIVVLLFSLILVCFSQLAEVRAQSVVYIREDGSIEGTDKIQRVGSVYTLTANLSVGIRIERNNTVLDGAGFSIQGVGSGVGVDLTNGRGQEPSRPRIENVTVKNLGITNFWTAIDLVNSVNDTIVGNYVSDFKQDGVRMASGDFVIKGNTFENNDDSELMSVAIAISYSISGSKIISENNFYYTGLIYFLSSGTTFSRNYWIDYNGTDNSGDGIGDTPYIITEELKDNQPLIQPINVPLFQEPNIPEFPSWIILPLLLTACLVVFVFKKKLISQSI